MSVSGLSAARLTRPDCLVQTGKSATSSRGVATSRTPPDDPGARVAQSYRRVSLNSRTADSRSGTWSLRRIAETWVRTVTAETNVCSAISAVE